MARSAALGLRALWHRISGRVAVEVDLDAKPAQQHRPPEAAESHIEQQVPRPCSPMTPHDDKPMQAKPHCPEPMASSLDACGSSELAADGPLCRALAPSAAAHHATVPVGGTFCNISAPCRPGTSGGSPGTPTGSARFAPQGLPSDQSPPHMQDLEVAATPARHKAQRRQVTFRASLSSNLDGCEDRPSLQLRTLQVAQPHALPHTPPSVPTTVASAADPRPVRRSPAGVAPSPCPRGDDASCHTALDTAAAPPRRLGTTVVEYSSRAASPFAADADSEVSYGSSARTTPVCKPAFPRASSLATAATEPPAGPPANRSFQLHTLLQALHGISSAQQQQQQQRRRAYSSSGGLALNPTGSGTASVATAAAEPGPGAASPPNPASSRRQQKQRHEQPRRCGTFGGGARSNSIFHRASSGGDRPSTSASALLPASELLAGASSNSPAARPPTRSVRWQCDAPHDASPVVMVPCHGGSLRMRLPHEAATSSPRLVVAAAPPEHNAPSAAARPCRVAEHTAATQKAVSESLAWGAAAAPRSPGSTGEAGAALLAEEQWELPRSAGRVDDAAAREGFSPLGLVLTDEDRGALDLLRR